MHAIMKGRKIKVLLWSRLKDDKNGDWYLIECPELYDEVIRHGKTGYYDEDEEDLLYCAEDRWLHYNVMDPRDSIIWIHHGHIQEVVEFQSNKDALSLLKKD